MSSKGAARGRQDPTQQALYLSVAAPVHASGFGHSKARSRPVPGSAPTQNPGCASTADEDEELPLPLAASCVCGGSCADQRQTAFSTRVAHPQQSRRLWMTHLDARIGARGHVEHARQVLRASADIARPAPARGWNPSETAQTRFQVETAYVEVLATAKRPTGQRLHAVLPAAAANVMRGHGVQLANETPACECETTHSSAKGGMPHDGAEKVAENVPGTHCTQRLPAGNWQNAEKRE